jgi:hypothetical protein
MQEEHDVDEIGEDDFHMVMTVQRKLQEPRIKTLESLLEVSSGHEWQ